MLGGELFSILRREQLHKLPIWSDSNKRCSDELHELPRRYVSRFHRCIELHGMHSWELLWYHGSLSRHWFVRKWTILCGFGFGLHKLPNGPISSISRVDELQQLSRGYLSGFNWLDYVRKLHGMHGGELLRHDRSRRRDWRMRSGDLLYRFFNGLFKLRNR